jgi:cobalt-zinc-cadmium efflux system outer membrane protein
MTHLPLLRAPTLSLLAALSLGVGVLSPRTAAASAVDSAGPGEDEIFAEWMRSSREVASLRTQVGAARFDIITASLWSNPELALVTSLTPAGEPPDGFFNWGAQLSIQLPNFGQIPARVAAARAAMRVAEVTVLGTLWERSAEIRAAMVERAFADARVALTERNLSELSRITGVVRLRVTSGANPQYDLLRVATTEATFRAALDNAIVERDRAEARLVALVASPGITAIPITRAGLVAFRGPENESSLLDMAMQRRPDLELARRGALAANALATQYRRDVIPAPSVFVGTYVTHTPNSLTLQGGVSIPLPTLNRNQGLIGRAMTEAEGQRWLASAVEARIRAEVMGAWRARAAARRSLDAFRSNGLAATAELLRRAEVSYQGGQFNIMDLLDAYRATWEAREQELDLERTLADAEADLERAAALVSGMGAVAAQ